MVYFNLHQIYFLNTFSNKFWRTSAFFVWATGTHVSDFWWHLPSVSKPRWIPLVRHLLNSWRPVRILISPHSSFLQRVRPVLFSDPRGEYWGSGEVPRGFWCNRWVNIQTAISFHESLVFSVNWSVFPLSVTEAKYKHRGLWMACLELCASVDTDGFLTDGASCAPQFEHEFLPGVRVSDHWMWVNQHWSIVETSADLLTGSDLNFLPEICKQISTLLPVTELNKQAHWQEKCIGLLGETRSFFILAKNVLYFISYVKKLTVLSQKNSYYSQVYEVSIGQISFTFSFFLN